MCYKLTKWIVADLKTLNQPDGLFIKNCFDVADKLKSICLAADERLLSFDVVSLYTNINATTGGI